MLTLEGRIWQLYHQHGTLRAAARATGINEATLCALRAGNYRKQVTGRLLAKLGMSATGAKYPLLPQ